MRWRYLPLYLGLISGFFFLFWRLFDLTIVRGSYYRSLAEENRVQENKIRAARGVIFDRHGQVLARNKVIYKQKLETGNWKLETREQALEIETKGGSEAAKLVTDLVREYPGGEILSHVIGYMGEAREDEIRNSKLEVRNYKLGDYIGRTGVEQQYEDLLRGEDGKELIETDALGKKLGVLGKIEPKAGKDLTLTIDLDLQKIAASEMKDKTGAVIVSNPQNGEILTLYSSPSFEPNRLSDLGDLSNLGDRPFFNRAIAGLYPPGSTFKMITAAAGLESGKITKNTQIEDTGVISVGSFQFPNWYWLQYGGKDGEVDVVKALKRSNDIFFYKVGEMVGIEGLEGWAGRFGVGKPLGIDLSGESAGAFRNKRDWYLGDTYHTAIGQGDLLVTPLQVNFWTNVIANGGRLCRPHLSNLGNLSNLCKDIGLKKETIDLIVEGMKEACQTGGTGWPLFDFKIKSRVILNEVKDLVGDSSQAQNDKLIPVACKTGTAEYGDSKNKTHAWFTIFAPISVPDPGDQAIKPDQVEPEISVTVLVEGGGEGSNVAAPIAKKILEEWFGR